MLDPAAVRAVVRAVLAEVGTLTPERIARNGPTVGVLLAAYLCAIVTLLG